MFLRLTQTTRSTCVRTFIMDGNFKAEHMKMKNPHDDVSLEDGEQFMVAEEQYKSHLRVAKDGIVVC